MQRNSEGHDSLTDAGSNNENICLKIELSHMLIHIYGDGKQGLYMYKQGQTCMFGRAHTEIILGIEEIIEHIINLRPMNVKKFLQSFKEILNSYPLSMINMGTWTDL